MHSMVSNIYSYTYIATKTQDKFLTSNEGFVTVTVTSLIFISVEIAATISPP